MTVPTRADAARRARVAYTTPGGNIAHGELLCIGGNRAPTMCKIRLGSGTIVTRPVDQVRLDPGPPRVVPS